MSNLNLVLLGLPSSGKSALLGSLQQAAQSKGPALGGSLVDVSGLAKLRQAAVDETYHPTREAVAAFAVKRQVNGRDEIITLHDTSGTDAGALLTGKKSLLAKEPLPKTLADADGVLLVVDASSSAAELDKEFRQFISFLEGWQAQRSQAAQVGGLPVFLVLAKCDKLAHPGETHGQWMQRIEDAKRKVGARFQAALADSRDLSFGRIDVRVWATAVKRPSGDRPGRASEPYQVAELFRQVFDAAETYRRRIEQSSQTLQGALVGLGGVAALLFLIVTWYYATQPTLDEAALESQVKTLLAAGEDNPSEMVREPIEDRLKELRELKANPAYATLPAKTREQIKATEDAIEAYQQVNLEVQKTVRNPRLAVRDSDLADIEKTLAAFDEKVKKWPDTRLAKRYQEWTADASALRQAIQEEEAWIRSQFQEGEKLSKAGGLVIAKQADPAQREAWFKAVHDFAIRGPRHKSNDRVADTTIPYRIVYQFDRITAAEREWRQYKDRLEKLRELALER